jgi:hypothetical protein
MTSKSATLKFMRNRFVELQRSLVRQTTNGTKMFPARPNARTKAQTIVAVVLSSNGNNCTTELIAVELRDWSQSTDGFGNTIATKLLELLSD